MLPWGTLMEITTLGHSSFALKTKIGRLVTDQSGKIVIDGDSESITIAGPGEYEAKGFSVTGLVAGQNPVYLIEAEDIRIGLGQTQTELLEGVDILLADSWKDAQSLKPRVVIPLDEGKAAEFAKDSGLEPRKEKKLSINKLSLPEETELVILER